MFWSAILNQLAFNVQKCNYTTIHLFTINLVDTNIDKELQTDIAVDSKF